MKRTFSHIIGLLCTISCCAQQLVFSPLDTSDGLSSNCVLHILELPDGRIAATTPQSIDVWDGHRFQIIPKDTLSSTPLPGYQGAYHVYADKNNRLWVKDYRKIWCYDKQLQFIPDCLPDSADDVFVDDQGDVFFIQQDTTHLWYAVRETVFCMLYKPRLTPPPSPHSSSPTPFVDVSIS